MTASVGSHSGLAQRTATGSGRNNLARVVLRIVVCHGRVGSAHGTLFKLDPRSHAALVPLGAECPTGWWRAASCSRIIGAAGRASAGLAGRGPGAEARPDFRSVKRTDARVSEPVRQTRTTPGWLKTGGSHWDCLTGVV